MQCRAIDGLHSGAPGRQSDSPAEQRQLRVRAVAAERPDNVVQGRPAAATQSATGPGRRGPRTSPDHQERRERRRGRLQRRRQERPNCRQSLRPV